MCIVKVTIYLRVSLSFSPSVVTMSTSRPAGFCRINRWTKNSAEPAERIENTFMGLWLFPDTVLTWNLTRKWWSQKDSQRHLITQVSIQIPWEQTNGSKRRLSRATFHTSHLSVAQVTLSWKNLTSEREPIEVGEESLAMKRGDLPLPLPGRVSNPRIRDDQALNDFARTRTRCTVLHLMMITHKHGLITVEHLSSHNLWKNR